MRYFLFRCFRKAGSMTPFPKAWLKKLLKPFFLKADGQQYDHFLNQVKINQNRIVSLENPRIDRDVFEVHCRLYHQLFSNFSTADPRLSGLEKALRQQDYGRYMVECMIG